MSNLESESSLSDQQQDDAVETKRCFDGEIEYLHEWVPIFFTASWMVRIRVNGKILFESEGRDEPWDEDGQIVTAQGHIFSRTHNKEYENWGGYRF